jgi:type IV pilus biogenesis protein CpaD/CtpE
MKLSKTLHSLVLAALIVGLAAGCAMRAPEQSSEVSEPAARKEAGAAIAATTPSKMTADQAARGLADIKIEFRLDPRITGGMYMGDRWVSPPTYTTVRSGKELTVQARAWGVDARGATVGISPKWTPANPDMVTVSPDESAQVTITVKSEGESRLKVALAGVSRELSVKATYLENGIRADITQ